MFLVFSLPRSRSTWLSVFLGREAQVGHDIGIGCAHPDEFVSKLSGLAGSCETGAGFAAPLIRQRLPDCKFVVVLRDPAESAASLEKFGFQSQLPDIERRYADLLEIAKDPETLTVGFHDLNQLEVCRAIYERCHGKPLDSAWWAQLSGLNIQVDMASEMLRIGQNAQRTAALKREVRRQLAKPGLEIATEPWSSQLWADAEALASAHFCEVDGGVEPNRRFKLDQRLMALMQQNGMLKVITARQDGELVGYFTWQIGPDVESEGLLKADQGAWYVAPGHPKAAHRMFQRSIEELRVFGVKIIFPHHRLQGRGSHLGRFFERRGAKPIQATYSMWIGGD